MRLGPVMFTRTTHAAPCFQKSRRARGFTIIETLLVVVIVGLLAVAAFPLFYNVGEDAVDSQFKGVMNAYRSSVNLAHSVWLAQGKASSIDFGGVMVNVTPQGWPHYTSNNTHVPIPYSEYNGRYSVQLWYALMVNPPRISGTVTPPTTGWYGSTVSGSRVTYTYFWQGRQWAFRYDRDTGRVNQTLP